MSSVVCSRARGICGGMAMALSCDNQFSMEQKVPRPKGGGFEITEGATGSLSRHCNKTIHHVVFLLSYRRNSYCLYITMIPPFETTFAVPLSCDSCIKDVSTSLYKIAGTCSRYPSIYFLSL